MTLSELTTEAPLSDGYDAATRDDPAFQSAFRHGFTTIDDLQMHYVVGGAGPTAILLLHGFPETWYTWLPIMPDLLPGHTVIAVDLPGLGDSTGTLPSYDKVTLAGYVHRLLDLLGFGSGVQVVSHDAGSGIAFALVTQWRDQFAGWLMMDFPVVGGSLRYDEVRTLSYHFAFHEQEPLFEQLVAGRERLYLDYFYRVLTPGGSLPMTPEGVDEYVRAYSRPGVLHNGSRYYQAWPQDEIDNRLAMAQPLTLPVHVLAEAPLLETFLRAVRDAAPEATGAALDTGHWMVHEAPDVVLAAIKEQFGY
ncbi:alpha/beta fold hydrolase [Promicromonospora thailandica]|uniref:Pimeloyl-ACP methyl ester carboxylesterase n=1 Tax=Promicromonospora thailandica TaxID=765201 RepID=A0A9X2G1U9_9MICO|nr:alpha/beta hydrolase [Promicromonospora thailandica]MCP2265507.1 Pimeloyl-ACP methyl ester carboxylesterase [Promicromonospora thailandica]BFF17067.1 alpha/beta hydrolase [Promicromonospora thailandica]